MSRLHILAGGQCLLHETVPLGNNAAGVPWRTALINSGMGGRTILASGTGPGQIATAESTQIASGELYEISFRFESPPGASAAQLNAAMDAQIANLSAETQARLASELRLYGLTRG